MGSKVSEFGDFYNVGYTGMFYVVTAVYVINWLID